LVWTNEAVWIGPILNLDLCGQLIETSVFSNSGIERIFQNSHSSYLSSKNDLNLNSPPISINPPEDKTKECC
jgi:hypothetical protein